jgi:N-glycosylase/DNA lyase
LVSIRWSGRSDTVRIEIPGRNIGEEDREFLRSRVRWMFRADEDFRDFWDLCRGHAVLRHCRSKRTGALLRCATVFEDTVKTICTVNCSWSNTKLMVSNLCRMFGEPCPGDGEAFTFPTPERLAGASEGDLREAKLGFRARYILELVHRVAGGDLDLDAWCRETDSVALRKSLLGVKGVGSYAANHLLMLLGHYDQIPCDSVVREYLGASPKAGQKEVERAATRRYGHWGRYTYLAYKFERVFRRLNYVDIVDGKRR